MDMKLDRNPLDALNDLDNYLARDFRAQVLKIYAEGFSQADAAILIKAIVEQHQEIEGHLKILALNMPARCCNE